jgi:hypothetical protein
MPLVSHFHSGSPMQEYRRYEKTNAKPASKNFREQQAAIGSA